MWRIVVVVLLCLFSCLESTNAQACASISQCLVNSNCHVNYTFVPPECNNGSPTDNCAVLTTIDLCTNQSFSCVWDISVSYCFDSLSQPQSMFPCSSWGNSRVNCAFHQCYFDSTQNFCTEPVVAVQFQSNLPNTAIEYNSVFSTPTSSLTSTFSTTTFQIDLVLPFDFSISSPPWYTVIMGIPPQPYLSNNPQLVLNYLAPNLCNTAQSNPIVIPNWNYNVPPPVDQAPVNGNLNNLVAVDPSLAYNYFVTWISTQHSLIFDQTNAYGQALSFYFGSGLILASDVSFLNSSNTALVVTIDLKWSSMLSCFLDVNTEQALSVPFLPFSTNSPLSTLLTLSILQQTSYNQWDVVQNQFIATRINSTVDIPFTIVPRFTSFRGFTMGTTNIELTNPAVCSINQGSLDVTVDLIHDHLYPINPMRQQIGPLSALDVNFPDPLNCYGTFEIISIATTCTVDPIISSSSSVGISSSVGSSSLPIMSSSVLQSSSSIFSSEITSSTLSSSSPSESSSPISSSGSSSLSSSLGISSSLSSSLVSSSIIGVSSSSLAVPNYIMDFFSKSSPRYTTDEFGNTVQSTTHDINDYQFFTDPTYGQVLAVNNQVSLSELISSVPLLDQFTLSLWIKPKPFPSGGDEYVIVGCGAANNCNGTLLLKLLSTGTLSVGLQAGDPTNVNSYVYEGFTNTQHVDITGNVWTQIGITYSVSSRLLVLYINGKNVQQQPLSPAIGWFGSQIPMGFFNFYPFCGGNTLFVGLARNFQQVPQTVSSTTMNNIYYSQL